jgi:peptidoglycan/LPS O-acetylase OafA/YrhL
MNKSTPAGKINNNQLDSLIILRGIAVLMVCFCHFGGALSSGFLFSNVFASFHTYGKYGVQIFFVISGFVIPLSLYKGEYHINNYGKFLYKRLLRLQPPYAAALLVTIIIMYFAYKARHLPFPETSISILKTFFYFHIIDDNPVFWTLYVEAQYYLFVGLFYFLLINKPRIAFFIIITAILAISQLISTPYYVIITSFVFFFIGNIGFLIYLKKGNRLLNYVMLIALLIFISLFYELPAFVSGLFAISFILFFKLQVSTSFKFIGTISYSIYLIHFPIGIKLINLIKSKLAYNYGWLLFLITLLIVIVISWGFYKIFEEISESWSRRIKYRNTVHSDNTSIHHTKLQN